MDFEKFRGGLQETLTGCDENELQQIAGDIVDVLGERGVNAAFETWLEGEELEAVKATAVEIGRQEFIYCQTARLSAVEGNQRFLDQISSEQWQRAYTIREALAEKFVGDDGQGEMIRTDDFNVLIVPNAEQDGQAQLVVALTSYAGLYQGSWNDVEKIRRKRKDNPFKVTIGDEKPVDTLARTTLGMHRSMVATAQAISDEVPDSNSRELWPVTLRTGEPELTDGFIAPYADVDAGRSGAGRIDRGDADRVVRVRPAVVVATLET